MKPERFGGGFIGITGPWAFTGVDPQERQVGVGG